MSNIIRIVFLSTGYFGAEKNYDYNMLYSQIISPALEIKTKSLRFKVLMLGSLLTSLYIPCTGAQNDVIDEYVSAALKNNITIQQKQSSYEKSLEALREAKYLFFPALSVEAYYIKSEGGRTMTLPISGMLNPVYANLNLINSSVSLLLPQYPAVEDYTVNFIRETEQETKLQLKMPVFNSSLIYNRKIKQSISLIDKMEVEVYKNELIKEVRTAYVNYLRSVKVLNMYKNTLKIAEENKSSMDKLYKNDKITIDEVYSASAEIKEIEKLISDAEKNKIMAAAYLNYLMNRDLESTIKESIPYMVADFIYDLSSLQKAAIDNRGEIKQADELNLIQDKYISMERKSWMFPQISLGASYGYQGEEYIFNKSNDLAQVGLSLSWEFFNLAKSGAKVEQAKYEKLIAEQKKTDAVLKIRMEVMDAYYSVKTALKAIELAKEEYEFSHKTFLLVSKKHSEGMVNHLEFSDALNNQLNAEDKVILAEYNYYTGIIRLERAAGIKLSTTNTKSE
jgi:outer membrane protein TolC